LPSEALLQVEHRTFDAHAAHLLLAVDLEGAHADVAGAEAAGHDLLHRRLAGNPVLPRHALHELKEPVRAAGIERIRFFLPDQFQDHGSHVPPRPRATRVQHLMTVPTLSKRSAASASSGLRALRIAVTRTPIWPASCEIGAIVARPTPRPR